MEKIKVATVLIPREDGKILMVSRKDNHTDFGLPGGKMDDVDNGDILETARRECLEESGIEIDKNSLILLYQGVDGVLNDKYDCYCYLAQSYSGEINNSLEEGVVQWGDPQLVIEGTFGMYNNIVLEIYKKLLQIK